MSEFNYMNGFEKMRIAFENAARKKGYSFDKDEFGRYEDKWLREAWEIFSSIDLMQPKK